MKRILFCIQTPLTKTLGAPKVIMELAEEMRELGWECELRGRYDLDEAAGQAPITDAVYQERLHRFLQNHAEEYDVIDYDHETLPYARTRFNAKTLFVARSVLLAQHLDQIIIPTGKGVKSIIGNVTKGKAREEKRRTRVNNAQITVSEADLVNVSNTDDKAELVRRGISKNKITVLPYGISRRRRILFDKITSTPPAQPIVAFVGTFDYRKGAREFPEIVSRLVAACPQVCFKLMGTKGLFRTEAEVRAHFPQHLQKHLEVIPIYLPEELPQLLSNCSVGIFPSYMEGFGFGVLEMLAASVPVVAYDAPGPPMMLPPKYLVPPGNWPQMSEKLLDLLHNEKNLAEARLWAQRQSQIFNWKEIAQATHTIYWNFSEKRKLE